MKMNSLIIPKNNQNKLQKSYHETSTNYNIH